VTAEFGRVYERQPLALSPEELVERVPALAELGLGATVAATL
jgi:hypothetical protein